MPNKQQRYNKRGKACSRGKCSPRKLFETPPQNIPNVDLAVLGRSNEEEHAILKQAMPKTKKALKQLSTSVKEECLEQMQRSILPDAPPRKRSRKSSPERVACRLSIGTPTTPPAPKLQGWKIRKNEEAQRPLPSATPLSTLPPPDVSTPKSTISLDSIVKSPGCSPLYVDWSCDNLKPDVKMDAADVSMTKRTPPLGDACGEGSSFTKGASYASTSSEVPKAVCESDLSTHNGDIICQKWLTEEDSDSEENNLELKVSEPDNFAALESAHDLNPESAEWLAQEDTEADSTMRQIAPVDHLTFNWSGDHNAFVGQREVFTGTPGPTFAVDDTTRPSDVFLKYFDEDFFNLLVTQTNIHSKFVIERHITERSRLNFWVDTDRNELAVFFAILIFQGLAPLSVEKDYWRENGHLTLKYFKELMTYNRYVLLKRMLHFTDNNLTGQEMTKDKVRLKKIWPVLEHLNSKFSSLYLPGRDVAIDESLLKWHGRLSFAQKIATKAAKVGVKSYELCEASTGYLWKFFVYTGKGQTDYKETDGEVTDEDREKDNGQPSDTRTPNRQTDEEASSSISRPLPSNAIARIVYDLANPLFNRGHTIVMDNFYNSPLLARYLKSNGTDCYGTLRVNREFVPEAIKSVGKNELRVGEIVHSYCRDLTVMMWRDSHVVSMLSTFHKGEVAGKEKYGLYKYKPQMVLDYNLSMGGVDKKDQLLSAYPIERSRNQIWYKKLFRRLLNVTILNSYIIFKSFHKNTIHRVFRQRLAEELVQRFRRPQVQFPIPVATKSLLSGSGFLRPILSGNHFIGTGKTKNARCVWCKNSRSKYICKQCNVALCLEICFEEFHTLPGN